MTRLRIHTDKRGRQHVYWERRTRKGNRVRTLSIYIGRIVKKRRQ